MLDLRGFLYKGFYIDCMTFYIYNDWDHEEDSPLGDLIFDSDSWDSAVEWIDEFERNHSDDEDDEV